MCRLKDEWLFFDSDKKELYSLNTDNWSKQKVDLKLLGIEMVDFWCKDFNR